MSRVLLICGSARAESTNAAALRTAGAVRIWPIRPADAPRITEAFAVSFGSTYSSFRPPGGPDALGTAGFQNLETTFKYRLFKNPEHEFVMSVGLSVEWGGTGAQSVGADPFNTYTPTLWFGKGFGDLPDTLSWIRPVAITGQIGYAIPGRSSTTTFGVDPDSGDVTADTEFHPRVLNWGGTVQYSMPYLKSAVIDLGLPDFINRFIPLVEATLQTPVSNTFTSGTVTTGTINPGFIWVGNTFQIGIEALIPINRQSGSNVGVIGQLHFVDSQGMDRSFLSTYTQKVMAVTPQQIQGAAESYLVPSKMTLVVVGDKAKIADQLKPYETATP